MKSLKKQKNKRKLPNLYCLIMGKNEKNLYDIEIITQDTKIYNPPSDAFYINDKAQYYILMLDSIQVKD